MARSNEVEGRSPGYGLVAGITFAVMLISITLLVMEFAGDYGFSAEATKGASVTIPKYDRSEKDAPVAANE